MFNCLTRATKGWLIVTLLLLSMPFSLVAIADTHEIEIKRMKFRTPELSIKAGDTVIWKNIEYRQYHSVWFESLGEPEPIDYIFPGDSYSRTFEQPGRFPYRCGPHPKMTGVIHVAE
ncbi:plastocyanin/azurin family copper-binding protein [Motiliproteus sp. MSK22-1]|uniref:plastocyanin/azurin family copper-binding protein n=1 Tax=Motiliproteus sp. MSK22-1 TaxID=1897630 RepID=UPI000977617C|nr:plastocyanin/azurin family copper-binding protein [Motiliproteus sp. MSK22-1]OMH36245.1 hypothetical protein BGP75_09845 [Motiliproteus sp. MSK22-1]